MWIYILILFLSQLIFLSGCIPATPEIEVIERHCALEDLREKPEIPDVQWVQVGDLKCVDSENYKNVKLQKSIPLGYANYCVRVYEGAKKRCEE